MDVPGHRELHFHRDGTASARSDGVAVDAEVLDEEVRRFFLDVVEYGCHRLHLAAEADVHGDLSVRVAGFLLTRNGHFLYDVAGTVLLMRGSDVNDALHKPCGGCIGV